MWLPQTLNSWLLFAIGVFFFFGGFYQLVYSSDRITSVGMVASGIGFTCLALTEGFADPTPRGRRLYRLGMIAFIIGLPLILKAAYELVSYEW